MLAAGCRVGQSKEWVDDVLLGDVVISLDTAAAQAAQRGHELRDELRVLLVHGLLHVLGYDHAHEVCTALLAAGASLEISSGLDGDGDNAYELAKRLRSYDCIFAFDDHIAAVNA